MKIAIKNLSVNLKDEGDMVVHALSKGPWESHTLENWVSMLTPESIVYDIGAYTGIYSLFARAAGATAYAFEPIPVIYGRLVTNHTLNGYNTDDCWNIGISDSEKKIPINITNGILLPSGSSFEKHPSRDTVKTIMVDVMSLDDISGYAPMASLIKIDAERHEEIILKYGRTTVKTGATFFIEILSADSFNNIKDLLSGYSCIFSDDSEFMNSETENFIKPGNYIFTPNESLIQTHYK
jgi:FkbM family methyltransferase